jgi:hypothetical protein
MKINIAQKRLEMEEATRTARENIKNSQELILQMQGYMMCLNDIEQAEKDDADAAGKAWVDPNA